MKTATLFLALCMISAVFFYSFVKKDSNSDNISISVNESDDQYRLSAEYPEKQTRKVQRYLDDYLEPSGNMSFVNAEIDATMKLDNSMTFHIKSSPGTLRIKFDKRKNSADAYRRMKKLGDELKTLLTEK